MRYEVLLLESAVKDLEGIYQFLKQRTSREAAFKEIEALEAACASLSENPGRGGPPDELERINTLEYRQIVSNPFRIIYQVVEKNVFVFGIIHGKRNIGDILRKRLSF
jgi:toxin ParE1/3/4